MSTQALEISESARSAARPWRSTLAVLAAFVTVVVLSLGTDQALHVLEVYPPWGQPVHDPGLNLPALTYRIVFTVLGGYVTARLAPRNPMRHALILGCIGLVPSIAGAIATIFFAPKELNPPPRTTQRTGTGRLLPHLSFEGVTGRPLPGRRLVSNPVFSGWHPVPGPDPGGHGRRL